MNSCVKKGCGFLLGAVLLLCIAVAIAIYVNKPKWKDEYGQRFTDVAYGSREHNKYDLYLPNDAAQQDSLPLILYVHGGSWIGGDKSEHTSDCFTWLKKGYATATMNYSLLNEDGVSIPTMLEEIGSCIRHIEGFASQKGVHIRQMAIGGTSAGGHLAMMYSFGCSHVIPLRFATIKVGPADLRILFLTTETLRPKMPRNSPLAVRDSIGKLPPLHPNCSTVLSCRPRPLHTSTTRRLYLPSLPTGEKMV